MRTRFDVQLLEHAVELVDETDEVSVDEHFGVARLDLQSKAGALFTDRGPRRGRRAARAAVPRVRGESAHRGAREPRVVVEESNSTTEISVVRIVVAIAVVISVTIAVAVVAVTNSAKRG